MSSGVTYLLRTLAVLGLGLTVWLLWPRQAMDSLERQAREEGRAVVLYWDRHSGHEFEARADLIREFNQSQDKIFVRAVPIGYNALMEKILTSTAGHHPPDICSLDGAFAAQLAPQGLLTPLDDFMAQHAPLHPDRFIQPILDLMRSEGHIWAVPTVIDTYCLLWNKDAFRAAGLDPERPPKTLEELEDYAARLTLRNDQGGIEQMGFLPWLPWDHTAMWGMLFGGQWYDPETDQAVASRHPAIRDSIAWQQRFTLDPAAPSNPPFAMDVERIAAFSKGLGEYMSANNPFYAGKVAMTVEGEWQVTFIPKYAPGLDWGVAPIPQPEGVEPIGFAPTCVADAIPITAHHPEEAKEFLRWFYSPRPGGGPSPVSDFCLAIHNIPPRMEEARQERFIGDPKFKVFVDALDRPVKTFPPCSATLFFNDTLERMREQVVFRKITPDEAVAAIDENVNRELTRIREMLRRTQP